MHKHFKLDKKKQKNKQKTGPWWMNITGVCHTHLERVKTGNDSAIFHLTALGRVGELALAVRPRTRSSLEFPTNLQRQPLCVPDRCHVHRHFEPGRRGRLRGEGIQRMWLLVRPYVSNDTGTNDENEWVKDMGKSSFLRGFVPRVWFWGEACEAWRSPTTCGPSYESVCGCNRNPSPPCHPGPRLGDGHRGLLGNLSLSSVCFSNKHSSPLYHLLSWTVRWDKWQNTLSTVGPWWKDCRAGGGEDRGGRGTAGWWGRRLRWTGTAERDNLLPFKAADKSCLSSVSGSVCRGGRSGWLPQ